MITLKMIDVTVGDMTVSSVIISEMQLSLFYAYEQQIKHYNVPDSIY